MADFRSRGVQKDRPVLGLAPAEANKWQQIPWLRDVTDGRRLAKEEKRPLFLWTVFGEPLDEC